LEVGLGHAAIGASPSLGYVFPTRTGCDAIRGPAFGFVVDESAHHAHESAVGNFDGGGSGAVHCDRTQIGKPRILPLDYAACTCTFPGAVCTRSQTAHAPIYKPFAKRLCAVGSRCSSTATKARTQRVAVLKHRRWLRSASVTVYR